MRVYIDTGHGMHNRRWGVYDSGAARNNTTEAAFVRTIAASVLPILRERGLDVHMAPDGLLTQRVNWQRRTLAPSDWLFSLHLNAASPAATGVEVFYAGSRPDLADWAEKLSEEVSSRLDRTDRGEKRDDQSQHSSLGILRASQAKTFLIELGFITNAGDMTALRDRGTMAVADSISYLLGALPMFTPSKEQARIFDLLTEWDIYKEHTPKNRDRYEGGVILWRALSRIGEVPHDEDNEQKAAFAWLLKRGVYSKHTAKTRRNYEHAVILYRHHTNP